MGIQWTLDEAVLIAFFRCGRNDPSRDPGEPSPLPPVVAPPLDGPAYLMSYPLTPTERRTP
jgi:hypothetical protein